MTRKHLVWHQDSCFPSEPVFVASPGAVEEDDGERGPSHQSQHCIAGSTPPPSLLLQLFSSSPSSSISPSPPTSYLPVHLSSSSSYISPPLPSLPLLLLLHLSSSSSLHLLTCRCHPVLGHLTRPGGLALPAGAGRPHLHRGGPGLHPGQRPPGPARPLHPRRALRPPPPRPASQPLDRPLATPAGSTFKHAEPGNVLDQVSCYIKYV